jgi:hypothetical protein
MLSCVALVRADVSEEHIASIIRMTKVGELVKALAVTGNRSTLNDSCHPDDAGDKFLRNIVLTRATRCKIPEDGILQCHRSNYVKSYKIYDVWSRHYLGPFTNPRHYLLPPLLSASPNWYSIVTLPFHTVFLRNIRRLLLTVNIVPSSQTLVTLMMEALRSTETSVLKEPHPKIQHSS